MSSRKEQARGKAIRAEQLAVQMVCLTDISYQLFYDTLRLVILPFALAVHPHTW
jgi:hypothetical protein